MRTSASKPSVLGTSFKQRSTVTYLRLWPSLPSSLAPSSFTLLYDFPIVLAVAIHAPRTVRPIACFTQHCRRSTIVVTEYRCFICVYYTPFQSSIGHFAEDEASKEQSASLRGAGSAVTTRHTESLSLCYQSNPSTHSFRWTSIRERTHLPHPSSSLPKNSHNNPRTN